MITPSKYTKRFTSYNLTRQKYDELYEFAVTIRDHKNLVSGFVNQNLMHFLGYRRSDFLREMRARYKGVIPSSFDAHVYKYIFDGYQNRFEAIIKNLKFEKITYQGFEVYKRDTKKHKKGDFKNFKNDKQQTPLSNCLTYLSRYGTPNTLEYVTEQLLICDEKSKPFYQNILDKCNKFGFDRLYNLALLKRERIVSHYSQRPIEYKSLSFRGRSRKQKIVSYNSKYGSVINAFVSLSGLGRDTFEIPVKFSKVYHGHMKDYLKNNPDYEYALTFNEKEHQVNVLLYKDGNRYFPEAFGDIETVGIDINVKNNLFTLSNGTVYGYDRKLVDDFCKLSKDIENLKKKDPSYVVGKRKQNKLDKLKSKMLHSHQETIAGMCKDQKSIGVGHFVLEDLKNSFGKSFVKDTVHDIRYIKIVHFVGISSLKQEVEHIARKYDIAVSTVQSFYTSRMCPQCGCIDKDNRKNQETFECIECGYSENADFNAAENIKNRVTVTVLRDKLLKQLDNGAFEPKRLPKEKVKDVLLSFRGNLRKNVDSESG